MSLPNISSLRPMNFSQVVGNTFQIKSIKGSLERNLYPSFSIISGKSGIGKTTMAYIIAKSIVCEKPTLGVSCDSCPTCMNITHNLIQNGREYTNIHIFRMSDQGGKIAARGVEEQIMTKPIGEGAMKVILLEECQGMSKEAQELLLPRLENLPETVKVIAMTTDTSSLLDTFKGRATPYKLNSPSQSEVQGLLMSACDALDLEVKGSTALNRIVEFGIRPRDSLNLLLKIAQNSQVVSLAEVNELLNLNDDSVYLRYLRAVKADMGAVLDFLDYMRSNDTELSSFMLGLNKFIMRLLTFKYRKSFIADSVLEACKDFLNETDENDLLLIQSILAEEAPKYGSERFDEPLFISTAFKIQKRNHKALEQRAIRSADQVKYEKQTQLEALQSRAESVVGTSADNLKVASDIQSILSQLPQAKLLDEN